MDNPLSYALSYVRRYIPQQILQLTYLQNEFFKITTAASLDDRIAKEVLYPVVLADCDLIGGTQTTIPLNTHNRDQVDQFTAVFRVPMALTNNRKITTALSIGYGITAINGYGHGQGTTSGIGFQAPSMNQNLMLGAASGIWASQTPIPLVSTARCTLIGVNTVLVQDSIALPPMMQLRCWLENEEGMAALKKPSYVFFARLVLFAVQADIYTKNKVRIDQGQVEGGYDIGAYKEVIESYSDAHQNYQDYFDNDWAQVTRFQDKDSGMRKIRFALGGRH